MASSSTIINNISSSITHQTPCQNLPKRPTSLVPFSSEKWSFFTPLKASFRPSGSSSFVASAVATPNSSVLSEEAFRGLGGFAKDLNLSESDDDFYDAGSAKTQVNVNELDINKLGLPQKLVQTLADKGITELFPIQVRIFLHFLV